MNEKARLTIACIAIAVLCVTVRVGGLVVNIVLHTQYSKNDF